METNLENLSALGTEHRLGKKRGRYPEAVWTAISSLRKTHTVEEISRTSGIDQTQIYRQSSGKRRSLFREVKISPPPLKNLSKRQKPVDYGSVTWPNLLRRLFEVLNL